MPFAPTAPRAPWTRHRRRPNGMRLGWHDRLARWTAAWIARSEARWSQQPLRSRYY